MPLSVQQVQEMAPDPASLAAGKKLAAAKHWKELGRSETAFWGLCQGSAVYQVKIELASLGYHCSCPSRKFPCKHTLGLLLIAAESEESLKSGAEPQWVGDWLARRQERTEKKAAKQAETEAKPVDEKAQARRAEQRDSRVRDGLDRIELWMCDRVREGLAGLQTQPPTFWSEPTKRLVDAQAPGLAAWAARWPELIGATSDWPRRLLADFGRLQLLIHAYRRLEQLDGQLQSDVRQLIGWSVPQEEVDRDGEKVEDQWVVIGQRIDDAERVRVQRSWIIGRTTNRTAMILQFSAGGQPFSEVIAAGTQQQAVVAYYPGAAKQRAKFTTRAGVESVHGQLPGGTTLGSLLDDTAERLAVQPWLNLFGYVIRDAVFIRHNDCWSLRDATGDALPLGGNGLWKALAVSGGAPCDVAVEWNGDQLRALGFMSDGNYWSL
ncbi:MAG: SWIM zinc finger family protein [Pirellulales bacterium]